MTIDEAKTVFLNRGYVEVEGGTIYDPDKWRESCRVISEWLEQQSCEDVISRQAVLSMQYRIDDSATLSTRDVVNVDDIENLLPVTPQPKTGHWIERRNKATGHIESVCSECGAEEGYPYNDYCGNCGAKMFEPQESEVEKNEET